MSRPRHSCLQANSMRKRLRKPTTFFSSIVLLVFVTTGYVAHQHGLLFSFNNDLLVWRVFGEDDYSDDVLTIGSHNGSARYSSFAEGRKALCSFVASRNNRSEITNCTVYVLTFDDLDYKVELLNQLLGDLRRDALLAESEFTINTSSGGGYISTYGRSYSAHRNESEIRSMLVNVDLIYRNGSWPFGGELSNVRGLRLKFLKTGSRDCSQASCPCSNSSAKLYPMSMTSETCSRIYMEREEEKYFCNRQHTNISASLIPKCHKSLHIFGRHQQHIFVIVGGGLVDGTYGTVFTRGSYLVSKQCRTKEMDDAMVAHLARINSHEAYTHYREVFVTSQIWGSGFFHNLIENMPRIAFYVNFLREHRNVRILALNSSHVGHRLKLYGLDPGRFVTGNVCADVVYLPHGGGCGYSDAGSVRLMAHHFRSSPLSRPTGNGSSDLVNVQGLAISSSAHEANDGTFSAVNGSSYWTSAAVRNQTQQLSQFPLGGQSSESSAAVVPNQGPNDGDVQHLDRGTPQAFNRINIILIQRSKKRYLGNHDAVLKLLTGLCGDFNLTCVVYSDKPAVPDVETTLEMFRAALVVVAPHGAGLANIVFAPVETYIVEVMSRREVNFCYQRLAYFLGHRWHGMISSTPNPSMTVDLDQLGNVLKLFLKDAWLHDEIKRIRQ